MALTFIFRFTDHCFSNTYVSTIGIDFKIKTIQANGKTVKLQVWDTAGQERYESLTQNYYYAAKGVMLVYDVTNAKSFDHIEKWLSKLKVHGNADAEKLIIRNKCDLEEKRLVSKVIVRIHIRGFR